MRLMTGNQPDLRTVMGPKNLLSSLVSSICLVPSFLFLYIGFFCLSSLYREQIGTAMQFPMLYLPSFLQSSTTFLQRTLTELLGSNPISHSHGVRVNSIGGLWAIPEGSGLAVNYLIGILGDTPVWYQTYLGMILYERTHIHAPF